MKKTLSFIFLLLMIFALAACGDISSDHIAKALRDEGLQVTYSDGMEENYGDFLINEKVRLTVSVKKNASEVKKAKEALEQNARDKNYEIQTFEVKNLLVVYYPSKDKDSELEKRIHNAISNIAK